MFWRFIGLERHRWRNFWEILLESGRKSWILMDFIWILMDFLMDFDGF